MSASMGAGAARIPPELRLSLSGILLPARPTHRAIARRRLLHHDHTLHRLRVVPELSGAEAGPLLAAAAAASAATALSFETLRNRLLSTLQADNDVADDIDESTATPPSPPPPPPASVADVWAAAWAGLDATAGDSTDTDTSEPLSQPVLWIQGLRAAPRRRLLALALAALEANAASLPVGASQAALANVCVAIIKRSSVQAAAGWLGYIPAALERAAAGMPGAPAAAGEEEDDVAVGWYALEERMGVYCSVLRLLRSTSIAAEEAAAAENQISDIQGPGQDLSIALDAGSLREQAAAALAVSSDSSGGEIVAPAVAGWRATQAGTRTASQLLGMAPGVVQDMAVRVADAVAAAYLAEASRGVWRPAAPSTAFSLPQNATKSEKITQLVPKNAMTASNGQINDGNDASGGAALEPSWWPAFVHPRLGSTRQLQRFSNRLFIARWVDQTFLAVAAAYDDRLPLFTLTAPGGRLRARAAPVRRAGQLAAMRGMRFWVSLALEAADAAGPALRALWRRAAEGLAWVLTFAVGRGMGLENNKAYAESGKHTPLPLGVKKKLAVITCMDSRLIPENFLGLGLDLGDAEVIRNGGGRVNADVVRSMIIAQDLLGCDTVLVIHHTDCGGQAAMFHPSTLAEHAKHVAAEVVGVGPGGLDMQPILPGALEASVREDVQKLRADEHIKASTHIYGLVFDTATGRLAEVCRG